VAAALTLPITLQLIWYYRQLNRRKSKAVQKEAYFSAPKTTIG